MGSNSRRRGDEGTSGVKTVEDNYELLPAELLLHSNVNPNALTDPAIQLPPHGPRAYEPPPPSVIQQVAMQRAGVVAQPQPHAFLQNGYVESVLHERLKHVKITWNHAGTNVAIAGSWDNWETTEPLQSVGPNFVIDKTLPIGIYQYRFIVDGYLTHAPEFPLAYDGSGYASNVLDLQDYIPGTLARLSDLEDPPSPPTSYDNIFLNEDEFSKPPPELPPQLPVTIRDEPSSDSLLCPTPTHLEPNHLYIHKTDGDQFAALRSTRRFQHKYATMVLYKYLRRE